MEQATKRGRTTANLDFVVGGLLFFGVSSLLIGLAMAFTPGVFFEFVGPFGTRNDHFIHDTASFQIALAVLLLVALPHPSWRVPALVANAVQWGLHSISHLIDIDQAHPTWIGYFDFVATVGGAAVLTMLAISAARAEPREGHP